MHRREAASGDERPLSSTTTDVQRPLERLRLLEQARALTAAAARFRTGIQENQSREDREEEGKCQDLRSKLRLKVTPKVMVDEKRSNANEYQAVVVPTSVSLRPRTASPPAAEVTSCSPGKETKPGEMPVMVPVARRKHHSLRPASMMGRTTSKPHSLPMTTRPPQPFVPFRDDLAKTTTLASMIVPFSALFTSDTEGAGSSMLLVQPSPRLRSASETGTAETGVSPESQPEKKLAIDAGKSLNEFPETFADEPKQPTGLHVQILTRHAPSIPSRGVMPPDGPEATVAIQGTRITPLSRERPCQQANARSPKPHPHAGLPPNHPQSSSSRKPIVPTQKVAVRSVSGPVPGYFARRPLQDVSRMAAEETRPDQLLPLPKDIDDQALHEAYLRFAKLHQEAERATGTASAAATARSDEHFNPNLPLIVANRNCEDTVVSTSNALADDSKEVIASEHETSVPPKREPFPTPNARVQYEPPILKTSEPTIVEQVKYQAARQGSSGTALPALWVPQSTVPPLPPHQIAVLESVGFTAPATGRVSPLDPEEQTTGEKSQQDPKGTEIVLPQPKLRAPELLEKAPPIYTTVGPQGQHRSEPQEVLFEEIAPHHSHHDDGLASANTLAPQHRAFSGAGWDTMRLVPAIEAGGASGGGEFEIEAEGFVESSPVFNDAASTQKPKPTSVQAPLESVLHLRPKTSPQIGDPVILQLSKTRVQSRPLTGVVTRRPITSDPVGVLSKLSQIYATSPAALPVEKGHQDQVMSESERTLAQLEGRTVRQAAQDISSLKAALVHSVQRQVALDNSSSTIAQTAAKLNLPKVLRPTSLPMTGGLTRNARGQRLTDETVYLLDDRRWLLNNVGGLTELSKRRKRLGLTHSQLSETERNETEQSIDTTSVTLKGKDDPFAHIPAFQALKIAVESTVEANDPAWHGSNLRLDGDGQKPSKVGMIPSGVGQVGGGPDMGGFSKVLDGLEPKIRASLWNGRGGLSQTSPRAVRAAIKAVNLQAGRMKLWKDETAAWNQRRAPQSLDTRSIRQTGNPNSTTEVRSASSAAAASAQAKTRSRRMDELTHKDLPNRTGNEPASEPGVPETPDGEIETEPQSLEAQLATLRQKIGIRGLQAAFESVGYVPSK